MFHTNVSMKVEASDQIETRDRIMDEAEKLFAEIGFRATSLRAITQAAEVNLAAVNYHFGSKDNLIADVILRKLHPINEERFKQLREHAEAGTPTLEQVLDAFFRPAFEYFQDPAEIPYLRLLGRSLYETGEFSEKVIEQEWMPLVKAFGPALLAAVPGLSEAEMMWRFHFTVGAMVLTVSKMDILEQASCGQCRIEGNFEPAIQKLIAFSAAGFREDVP